MYRTARIIGSQVCSASKSGKNTPPPPGSQILGSGAAVVVTVATAAAMAAAAADVVVFVVSFSSMASTSLINFSHTAKIHS